MLRFHNIVFGPIHSRRLGSSLGINLLPEHGKLCNFDCIYCECGWNRDGRGDTVMPSAEEVSHALEAKLKECTEQGTPIDSITFSGHGEPTLNPHFPEIIAQTVSLRDRYCPRAKVSVLTNATTVNRPEIFDSYDIEAIVSGLSRFCGDFVLQTMFLKSPEFDTASEGNLPGWMDIVRRLRPREIMVYTLDRETPEKDLEKYTVEEMTALVQPLIDEGFFVQIRG